MSNERLPARTGLSLYANLLDPSKNAPGTISSAPITYNKPSESSAEDEATKKQQPLAASLRFQPTKRPQLAAQKAKAKAIASRLSSLARPPETPGEGTKALSTPETTDKNVIPVPPAATTTVPAHKTTAADWLATASDDEDVNAYYASSRQRGGRKKRKKNKDTQDFVQQDWDDIYDPSRPNNYEEYKHSDEKIREVREWKDILYRHRMQGKRSSDYGSDSERSIDVPRNKQFAPPSISFAPPPQLNDSPPPPPPADTEDEYVPPAPSTIPDDATGDDAFARRMRLSGMQIPPPPPPASQMPSNPPAPPPGSISRAPVRYSLPSADPELPATMEELQQMEMDQEEEEEQEEAPRSSRPGQAKFAERLMSKYGWSRGQGLGKEGTGVTTALYAKVDKRKKKSDAEGGGFVTPAAIGRILGGTRSKAGREAEEGKFGAMSEVVRLEGMLKGMDMQAELLREDGNIMQEIGEECGDKYGNVERVYIHQDTDNDAGAYVFVHFTQPLSALRAVNALEGRVFNGNEIRAKFWPREKFDQKAYE